MIKTLEKILPSEGHYCLVGLKTGVSPRQSFHDTLEELQAGAENLLADLFNVYYGCATFENKSSRTQENAKWFKSFWLDLDCGKGKPFANQGEALLALKKFCESNRLPAPTLISSGRGIHTYWTLLEAISQEQWKPTADRLKALCKECGFEADPAVTADCARILRVPDTLNFKDEPPQKVLVLREGKDVDFVKLSNMLGTSPATGDKPFVFPPETQRILDDRQNKFSNLIDKIKRNKGCAQIENILENQQSIEYNLWRAGLSIAANCVDGEAYIHKMSEDHPDYTPEETQKKIEDLIDKPYRCSTFEEYAPNLCDGCTHKGVVNSPIALCKEVKKAEPEQNNLPELPFPYFISKEGSIYKTTDDEEKPDVLVYAHSLRVTKRLKDKESGELVFVRLKLPKDEAEEFMIPLSTVTSKEELRKFLSAKGVVVMPKAFDQIMMYLIVCINNQQYSNEAEIMRRQFGWTSDNSAFILGDKEISAKAIRYSPPSEITERLCEYLKPTGSLDVWKEVVSVYDMPNFEPHAFGFFTAFGAPLIKHLGYNGAMINLINSSSGTGKSTILKMCNSVYGHPSKLLAQETDTFAHKMNRLGIMNNLPYTIDEITNMPPERLSTLIYGVSQGEGPGRMQSQNNIERRNDTSWALIALASSNSSIAEKLGLIKSFADGEIMRLLEYRIDQTDNLTKSQANKLFEGKLLSNYGVAGEPYIQYITQNLPKVIDVAQRFQEKLDRDAGLDARERFWSAVISCNITGAYIAKALNLIDLDIDRVYRWATSELVPILRDQISEPEIDFIGVLGAYQNANWNKFLIIDGVADKRTSMPPSPIQEPRNEMVGRWEPDTGLVFIYSRSLRAFCAEQQIIFKDFIKHLTAQGIAKGTQKKRLGKGTALDSAPVDTHIFDDTFLPKDFDLGMKNDKTKNAGTSQSNINDFRLRKR
jgi:energy-coupling factor transporter ATP-binding protein EcfA2